MAVAPMFHVVHPLQKFRHRAHGRTAFLNGERDALKINRVLYEYSYCAGHGEPKAAEEVVGPLLDVVVYSDVDLCHGSFLLCVGMISNIYMQRQDSAIQIIEL